MLSRHFRFKMLLTMKMLLATALCLCFAVPSPVLSFTMPERFAENEMADGEGLPAQEKEYQSIAQHLIHSVLTEAEADELAKDKNDEGGEMAIAKRYSGVKRPEREIRSRAHPGYQLGRRNPVSSRSKFTFGKRSSLPFPKQSAQQMLEDDWQDRKFALLRDAALYDNDQDTHEVQKDAYSAFSFGKRGMSAFSYGKRALPSFYFGKRAMPSFAFGKRNLGGSAFVFGRREWDPTDQEFEETGPYEIKRADLAFAYGKRDE